jgi:hypothetical protein
MKFRPYYELDGHSNIIVDGAPHKDSKLVLSHWKASGTKPEFIRDTSAQIVLDYLESHELPKDLEYVSNDHFDEDGLVGIFSILNKDYALANKELLIDIATAGDFANFKQERAAKIVFTINHLLDKSSGFVADEVFDWPYPKMAAHFYKLMLDELPKIIENLPDYQSAWGPEFNRLKKTEEQIANQEISIKELPEHQVVIVDYGKIEFTDIHKMAIYNKTKSTQVVYKSMNKFRFQYRYEGWVQLSSFRQPLRVDLAPLAAALNKLETGENKWQYDGSNKITPALHSDGESSLSFELFYQKLWDCLDESKPDWNPYE